MGLSLGNTGRRLLRVATSSLFAEYAAPGLIEIFAGRADDLDVELSVHDPQRFPLLLLERAVDVAIGPRPATVDASRWSAPRWLSDISSGMAASSEYTDVPPVGV